MKIWTIEAKDAPSTDFVAMAIDDLPEDSPLEDRMVPLMEGYPIRFKGTYEDQLYGPKEYREVCKVLSTAIRQMTDGGTLHDWFDVSVVADMDHGWYMNS